MARFQKKKFREPQLEEITTDFDSTNPTNHCYIISGVRGSGKTVALYELEKYYCQKENWIVIDLAITDDMIKAALDRLASKTVLANLDTLPFVKVGVSIVNDRHYISDSVLLDQALHNLTERKYNVLFTIDEISINSSVRSFMSQFQIYLREEYNVYLLAAGLYDNIRDLKNDNVLTFLYRAGRINLAPLNLQVMANIYRRVFDLDKKESLKMAKLTNGFPFAFQTLGFLRYQNPKKSLEELLDDYDTWLDDFVYEKIWDELSNVERQFVVLIVNGYTKVSEIREKIGKTPQYVNRYRKRLMDKGLIDGNKRGCMVLILPRFKEFIGYISV